MTTLGVWLIVTAVLVIYLRYWQNLKSTYEIVIAVAPSMIFFAGGILMFSRDRKKIKRAREKEELTRTVELEWGQALRHDILTYLTPVLILVLPFLFDQLPNLTTVLQACTAFLVLTYLKFTYWGEL